MPSAAHLCNLYNKEELIKEFIEGVIKDIELDAKHGEKYKNVDVPIGLTRKNIEIPLKNAFPDCKISWKWFIQSYRIQWA